MQRTGILLVNLGTPDAPTPSAIGRYLKEFLMDPFVLRMPFVLRWFLVHVLIVPRRRFASAKLYKNIWTPKGSPLLFNTVSLGEKLQKHLGDSYKVAIAMRYGKPDLTSGLKQLLNDNVKSIHIVPLYPQYALSSTETCLTACEKALAALNAPIPVTFEPEFFGHPAYQKVLGETVRETLAQTKPDMLMMSFHGLPESHIHWTDPDSRCLNDTECCANFASTAPHCYRAQCYVTADAILREASWPREKSLVAFQSRLTKEPWLQPFTDVEIKRLGETGIKTLAVACPAFTADCLETLEEIGIRAQTDFAAAGGQKVTLIPSLNDRDDWVQALGTIITTGKKPALKGREVPLYLKKSR